MSSKNSDKGRNNRERKKKLLRRKHNQKMQKSLAIKTTAPEQASHAEDDDPVVSTRLRNVVTEGRTDSRAFEIVVYKHSSTESSS